MPRSSGPLTVSVSSVAVQLLRRRFDDLGSRSVLVVGAGALARSTAVALRAEAVDEILLGEPFEDPDPDPHLSTDVDHYLYGAPRRSRRRR